MRIPRMKVRGYLGFIRFTRKHPLLCRAALGLAYKVPPLKDALSVSPRIYMGGRILESYRVDRSKGEISFAGVDRQIVGSEFLGIVFRDLEELIGKEEAQKVMYEMHFRAMEEQLRTLDFEAVLPSCCASMFWEPVDPEALEGDPFLGRLYGELESMLVRLLFSESGWGAPKLDSTPIPSMVTVRNSVESLWMRPSTEPVCFAMAGSLAALVSFVAGDRYGVRESRCAATGAPECVFAVEKEG